MENIPESYRTLYNYYYGGDDDERNYDEEDQHDEQ